ncbi:hypothetical protein [Deinococcus rufus]|uniref:Uncharacterized protein n=1 Tax=Deinococcus rufus TaxID=2136097 RepID=A0ABV7Z9X2_9DEIO
MSTTARQALRTRSAELVINAVQQGTTPASDDAWFVLPPDTTRWDPFVLLVDDTFSTRGFR